MQLGGRQVEAIVAESPALRLLGLIGLDRAALVPLLIPRCRSIHTFGMRAAIDLVWLDLAPDGRSEVLGVRRTVPPGRVLRAPRSAGAGRAGALELPNAAAAATRGMDPSTLV